MKLEHHIAISTIISGILFALFKSWGLSIASFITGVFIDIDHLIDYFKEHGYHIHLREILDFFYKEKHQKITLFFHGWEWLLCLGITVVLTDYNPWVTGVLIGYEHHIVGDYLYSRANFRTYSLLWRWQNNFNSYILFPRSRGYDPRS
jgi:CDP-diglyceride synthetase